MVYLTVREESLGGVTLKDRTCSLPNGGTMEVALGLTKYDRTGIAKNPDVKASSPETIIITSPSGDKKAISVDDLVAERFRGEAIEILGILIQGYRGEVHMKIGEQVRLVGAFDYQYGLANEITSHPPPYAFAQAGEN